MSHFMIEYRYSANVSAQAASRPRHIAYRKALGDRIALAGPLLDDAGHAIGSIIVLEAADRTQAKRDASGDPFIALGVFELVSIRPFRIAAIAPPPAA
jgi:uncharacterized protein YciI